MIYICIDYIMYSGRPECTIVTTDIRGGPKNKPPSNNQKIVLNRIKTCQ